MEAKKKNAGWRIDESIIQKIAEIAIREKRSAAAQAEYFLEQAIQQFEQNEARH